MKVGPCCCWRFQPVLHCGPDSRLQAGVPPCSNIVLMVLLPPSSRLGNSYIKMQYQAMPLTAMCRPTSTAP